MTTVRLRSVAAIVLAAAALPAQPQSVIVTQGYWPPAPTRGRLAPGQVVTFYLQGLSAPDAQASGTTWPTELAGITARLRYFPGGYAKALPIFSVRTVPCNDDVRLNCHFKAVTVQLPTDLPLGPPPHSSLPPVFTPSVTIYENGAEGFSARYEWVPSQFTVLNDCHVLLAVSMPTCVNQVTRADGSLVRPGNEPRPGESIVVYAVGLGLTNPVVAEGQPAPSPAPRAQAQPRVWFSSDYVPYEGPVDPAWAQVDFAGLVPGYVGLYQVNLRLPTQLPPGPAPADPTTPLRWIFVTLDAAGRRTGFGLNVRP